MSFYKTSPHPEESSVLGRQYSSQRIPARPPIAKKQHSIASQWTIEISNLINCGSAFEIASCLRDIDELLKDIDKPDRLRYCKSDFEIAIGQLRERDMVIPDTLTEMIISMTLRYFNENICWMLPEVILQEIFMMIPVGEISPIASVCKHWKKLYKSDIIWKTLYVHTFLRSNPTSSPTTFTHDGYWGQYRSRLECPQVGDDVEVAWRGKFRLEAQDVYQGLAWWVAKVVETRAPRYKIHYPGWESRWDEWVDRRRLRWGMPGDTTTRLVASDRIELWCCGFNVPGAWLESTVRKVRRGKYNVLRTQSSGSVWVDRDRIRPRRRKQTTDVGATGTVSVPGRFGGCVPQQSCAIM